MEALILYRTGANIPPDLIQHLSASFITGIPLVISGKQELSLPRECLSARLIILIQDKPHKRILKLLPLLKPQREKGAIVLVGDGKRQDDVDLVVKKEALPADLGLTLKKIICSKEDGCKKRIISAYDIFLDLDRRIVTRGSKVVSLRNKEIALLEFFIINLGKILSRELILECVWDRNADFSSNTIDVHVNRLRKKLYDGSSDEVIHTVHSIGYRFALE